MSELYEEFQKLTITELHEFIKNSESREEALFFQRLLSLKMGFAQEKVVGKELI